MTQKLYTVLIFAQCLAFGLVAQTNELHPCGTTGRSAWLDWYQTHQHEFPSKSSDTAWLNVPVTIHNVAGDNGVGYYPEVQLWRVMCDLNRFYEPARIRFYLVPGEMIIKHASSYWYEHDYDGGGNMIVNTAIPGRVNVYFVESAAGNCGYAYIDAVVMAKQCSGAAFATIAHELGHHLSLPHTFYGWEGENPDYSQPAPAEIWGYEVEKTDGSNCYNSGDGFCDTPPDYLDFRWTCDSMGRSATLQHDPDGVPFRSDGTYYMSYSNDACMNRFSDEQIAAMRNNLYTEHVDYLDDPYQMLPMADSAVVNLIAPLDSAIQQFNNFSLTWAPVDNATFYRVEVSSSPIFSVLFYNQYITETSVSITASIPNNKTLYWRVRPYNELDLCRPLGAPQIGIFKTRDLTNGTSAPIAGMRVQVAPNPVRAGRPAQVLVATVDNTTADISVVNVAGQLVWNNRTTLNAGENAIDLPIQNFGKGQYFVQIRTETGLIVEKFVVL
jgi:hypothetical protein